MTYLLIVLGFLVTARVTRFVTADALAAPFRAWVTGRWGPDGRMDTLVHCAWCSGIWIAAPVAAYVAWLLRDLPIPTVALGVGLWLGYSYLYGLVKQNLDGE